jgi:hypothetical protein
MPAISPERETRNARSHGGETIQGHHQRRHPRLGAGLDATVAEFRRFVAATGYLTVAERSLDPAQYPGADPALLSPGSLVFFPTSTAHLGFRCVVRAAPRDDARGPQ